MRSEKDISSVREVYMQIQKEFTENDGCRFTELGLNGVTISTNDLFQSFDLVQKIRAIF
jgi:hypothetical protein